LETETCIIMLVSLCQKWILKLIILLIQNEINEAFQLKVILLANLTTLKTGILVLDALIENVPSLSKWERK